MGAALFCFLGVSPAPPSRLLNTEIPKSGWHLGIGLRSYFKLRPVSVAGCS